KEGDVFPKIDIELIDRPYPQWTIAACNEVMYIYKDNLRLADELASCDLLADSWRKSLQNRLRGKESSIEPRVFGPNKEYHLIDIFKPFLEYIFIQNNSKKLYKALKRG